MFEIYWAARARKQLAKLGDRDAQLRIFEAAGELTRFPRVAGLEALRHHRYGYRLRVGRYRILFDVDTERRTLTIREIRKRDERTY